MFESFSSISHLRDHHEQLKNSDQNNRLREIEQWLINRLESKISEYKCFEKFNEQLTELLETIITEQKSTNRIKISFNKHNYEIPFGYFLEMLLKPDPPVKQDENMHEDLITALLLTINANAISDNDVKSAFGKVMQTRTKPESPKLYCDCDLNKKQENNIKKIEEHFNNYESSISVFKKTINTQIDSGKVHTILTVKNILEKFVEYVNNKNIKGDKDSKTEKYCKMLQDLDKKTDILNSFDAYVNIYRTKLLKELKEIKNNPPEVKCDYLGWDPKVTESYPDCYEKASSNQKFSQLAESYPDENLSVILPKKMRGSISTHDMIGVLSNGNTNLTFSKEPLKPTVYFDNADSAINCLYKIYVQDKKNKYVPPGLLYDYQKIKIYAMHQDYTKAFEHIGKYAAEIKEGISPEARNDENLYYHKKEGIALFYKRNTNGSEKLVNIAWNTPSKLISKCLKEVVKDADSPEQMVDPFIRMLKVCDPYVGGTPVESSMEIKNYNDLKKSCLQTITSKKISMFSAESVVDHVLKHNLSNYKDPETGKKFSLLKFTDEEAERLIKDYFKKVRSLSEKFTAKDASRIKFTLNGYINAQFGENTKKEKKTKKEMEFLAYSVKPNLELILKTAY